MKYNCMTALTGANSSYKMRKSLDSQRNTPTYTENKALKPDPYYIHACINTLLCTKLYASISIWPNRFNYP